MRSGRVSSRRQLVAKTWLFCLSTSSPRPDGTQCWRGSCTPPWQAGRHRPAAHLGHRGAPHLFRRFGRPSQSLPRTPLRGRNCLNDDVHCRSKKKKGDPALRKPELLAHKNPTQHSHPWSVLHCGGKSTLCVTEVMLTLRDTLCVMK